MSYHGERHAVNLMFVFGLVLSEGTVPGQERGERETDADTLDCGLLEKRGGEEAAREGTKRRDERRA